MKLIRTGWLLGLMLLAGLATAAGDLYAFRSPQQEQQFHRLTRQLRCPKCQNNSIADSGSIIAADMRQKVYELLQQGKSEQQIIDYMVARYGNFVTYDPPLTPSTVILWLGPILLLLIGLGIVMRLARRRLPAEVSPDAIATGTDAASLPDTDKESS